MPAHPTPANPYPPTTLSPHGIISRRQARDADIQINQVNGLRVIAADFEVGDRVVHAGLPDVVTGAYHLSLVFENDDAFGAFRKKMEAAFHLYDLEGNRRAREEQIATSALLLRVSPDIIRAAYDVPHPNCCDECGEPDGVSPNGQGDPINVRAYNRATNATLFYHPDCASQYEWLPGEILVGEHRVVHPDSWSLKR